MFRGTRKKFKGGSRIKPEKCKKKNSAFHKKKSAPPADFDSTPGGAIRETRGGFRVLVRGGGERAEIFWQPPVNFWHPPAVRCQ